MEPLMTGVIGVVVLVVLIALGMRVVFAGALVGTAGLVLLIGWDAGVGIAGTVPHSRILTYELSVLPLFILIGFLAFHAGLTEALFDAARKWIAWVPGGLAVASVFGAAGFAAVSGSSTSTAAVFARIAIPDMLRDGYDRRLAAGVVAASGTLASLIPPSGVLVLYAVIVEESVGRLLIAGLVPGVVSALVYASLIVGLVKLRPKLAPSATRFSWADRLRSIPGTFPVLLVLSILFGCIYFGWATPTEAGALGAFLVLITAILRGMRWKSLKEALLETAQLTVTIFSIIWGVLIFVRFLGFARVTEVFAEALVALPFPPIVTILLILFGYTILGMFMDAIGMMLLTLPVVYPAVLALGYDPIWFGIILVKMVEICLITPPIGLNCFVVHSVRPDIPLEDIFRGILPLFIADVVTVALLLAFPDIILFLPNLMFGG